MKLLGIARESLGITREVHAVPPGSLAHCHETRRSERSMRANIRHAANCDNRGHIEGGFHF